MLGPSLLVLTTLPNLPLVIRMFWGLLAIILQGTLQFRLDPVMIFRSWSENTAISDTLENS